MPRLHARLITAIVAMTLLECCSSGRVAEMLQPIAIDSNRRWCYVSFDDGETWDGWSRPPVHEVTWHGDGVAYAPITVADSLDHPHVGVTPGDRVSTMYLTRGWGKSWQQLFIDGNTRIDYISGVMDGKPVGVQYGMSDDLPTIAYTVNVTDDRCSVDQLFRVPSFVARMGGAVTIIARCAYIGGGRSTFIYRVDERSWEWCDIARLRKFVASGDFVYATRQTDEGDMELWRAKYGTLEWNRYALISQLYSVEGLAASSARVAVSGHGPNGAVIAWVHEDGSVQRDELRFSDGSWGGGRLQELTFNRHGRLFASLDGELIAESGTGWVRVDVRTH